jgi:hypothetical protein
VSNTNFLVYTPMLADVAGGTIEPRHAVPALRAFLTKATFREATVEAQAPGPSWATRPPAELCRGALRWHPAADLSPAGPAGPGARSTRHPCGWRVRGARPPARVAVSPVHRRAQLFSLC